MQGYCGRNYAGSGAGTESAGVLDCNTDNLSWCVLVSASLGCKQPTPHDEQDFATCGVYFEISCGLWDGEVGLGV